MDARVFIVHISSLHHIGIFLEEDGKGCGEPRGVRATDSDPCFWSLAVVLARLSSVGRGIHPGQT